MEINFVIIEKGAGLNKICSCLNLSFHLSIVSVVRECVCELMIKLVNSSEYMGWFIDWLTENEDHCLWNFKRQSTCPNPVEFESTRKQITLIVVCFPFQFFYEKDFWIFVAYCCSRKGCCL